MQGFDIYFLGEMLPDAAPDAVKAGVAGLFKVELGKVDKLFSGKPLRVKQGVDSDTASRYRAAFREVGALIQIVPTGSQPPQVKGATHGTASSVAATTAPASETPSKSTVTAHPAMAKPSMSLAAPGAIMDESRPPPPADIDTSGLEVLPANTGSLEDCKIDKPHRLIPDISHLRIVDD